MLAQVNSFQILVYVNVCQSCEHMSLSGFIGLLFFGLNIPVQEVWSYFRTKVDLLDAISFSWHTTKLSCRASAVPSQNQRTLNPVDFACPSFNVPHHKWNKFDLRSHFAPNVFPNYGPRQEHEVILSVSGAERRTGQRGQSVSRTFWHTKRNQTRGSNLSVDVCLLGVFCSVPSSLERRHGCFPSKHWNQPKKGEKCFLFFSKTHFSSWRMFKCRKESATKSKKKTLQYLASLGSETMNALWPGSLWPNTDKKKN